MKIVIKLDVMLARRKMRLNTLAERVGVTAQNLSVLKTGKAKAIRFSTLEKLCEVLECQPGDLMAFGDGDEEGFTSKMAPMPVVRIPGR